MVFYCTVLAFDEYINVRQNYYGIYVITDDCDS